MKSFKDTAINTKLTMLVVLAGGVALLLSSISFVINDAFMIRASLVQQLSALADVLGANSTAALNFQDPKTAVELLNSLSRQPAVEYACIYDANGKPFATYRSSKFKEPAPQVPATLGYEFTSSGHLDVVHAIEHGGVPIGRIFLRAGLEDFWDQMAHYVSIAAAVMMASLVGSILISSRLQRLISVPIRILAEATQQISVEGDYGIRVVKTADDELGTLYDQFNAMLDQIQHGAAAIQQAQNDLELKIEQRTSELVSANKELSREVSERLRAEKELETVHQQLLVSARQAGMAEVATGVLHNVGNVLNSINVSATLVSDRMRQSRTDDFLRASQLLESHADDLAAFITTDPKGKQLPHFFSLLASFYVAERTEMMAELELLTTKVNHVKVIVATQQSYAGVAGVIEAVDVATMIDDAMKLNVASLDRDNIVVRKEYEPLPKIRVDKQKVLQILVNLITNAQAAFSEGWQGSRREITLRSSLNVEEQMIYIEIIDNAVGIPAEHLTRIFSHGFTTKPNGHGFGLHTSANAAGELGGTLTAYSDGVGKGAKFVLTLPYEPAEVRSAVTSTE
jgi:two-component system, NtrC family, sensor kinase